MHSLICVNVNVVTDSRFLGRQKYRFCTHAFPDHTKIPLQSAAPTKHHVPVFLTDPAGGVHFYNSRELTLSDLLSSLVSVLVS
jgi:hypothetical protein